MSRRLSLLTIVKANDELADLTDVDELSDEIAVDIDFDVIHLAGLEQEGFLGGKAAALQ